MRSTNIVVFLVLVNSAAVLVGSVGIADVGAAPEIGQDNTIQSAQDEAFRITTERSALDAFISGIIAAAGSVQTVFEVAVAGPLMLANLGVPGPVVTFLTAPLYIIVALDILQVLSGRSLS
jgi:hypothetical protein